MRYSELDVLPARPNSTRSRHRAGGGGFRLSDRRAFADDRTLYVAESGLPFGGARPGGRIVRVEDGWPAHGRCSRRSAPAGERPDWHAGGFYIAEGGAPGRIAAGSRALPADHPGWTAGRGITTPTWSRSAPTAGSTSGQGAMTNSAWSGSMPTISPGSRRCRIRSTFRATTSLAGQTFGPMIRPAGLRAPRRPPSRRSAMRRPRARIAGRAPCAARGVALPPGRLVLEVFAWGLRNAYGLAFLPDGRLLAPIRGRRPRLAPDRQCAGPALRGRAGPLVRWPDFIVAAR